MSDCDWIYEIELEDIEEVQDHRAAQPGTTIWAVWQRDSPEDPPAPVIISATHKYAREWASKQPDPDKYCFTRWMVSGDGYPAPSIDRNRIEELGQ